MTKACDLACKHCRASAITEALPDEMTLDESLKFLEQVTEFGKPYPVVILTGGDVMKKKGLEKILEHANELGIPISMSPSATPLINEDSVKLMKKYNVRSLSLSLDGSKKETHDWLRGVDGTFDRTLNLIDYLISNNFTLQVNTVVFQRNVMELPEILKILLDKKVKIWEVFFLIKTGRGIDKEDLDADGYEDVNNFLAFASRYGIIVRTVESPIFRRILIERQNSEYKGGELYNKLIEKTKKILGEPKEKIMGNTSNTRDGKGIIFVAHNGEVNPSGFLPFYLGNVKMESIVKIYRENNILKKLRDPDNFKGKCGLCNYRDICGGSRARAYSYYGDIFQEDPRCNFKPESMKVIEIK